jgi:two-component system, NtrC family, sensor histidine kinase HydH
VSNPTANLTDAERAQAIRVRADRLFSETYARLVKRTDRLFGALMLGQWLFAIILALAISPRAWAGSQWSAHVHVYAAVALGAAISSLPLYMIATRPGAFATRFTVACAQMLWSALLIHLTGGRIETHFHVFGSLAILAFYRDFRVLVPATVVVAADHFARGMYWPESVYGIANPDWWRFLEHAAWVVFIDVFLVLQCVQATQDLRDGAERHAEVEFLSESERQKTEALNTALSELENSQDALIRNERLAAVGQLAASVGHELRNPLTAIRNAHEYIGKKIDLSASNGSHPGGDERVKRFRGVIERELDACSKIISDLLDFARARSPVRRPYPLRALVTESIELVPKRSNVTLVNEVPEDLAVPEVDRDQFRQVFVNLVQNASEAIHEENSGEVRIRAEADERRFSIVVADNGSGIPHDVRERIFQPLFSTKTKGTGLGLAIVQSTLKRHGASVQVDSKPGLGTTFTIELPRVSSHGESQIGATSAHPVG